jgi:hypothetical protein
MTCRFEVEAKVCFRCGVAKPIEEFYRHPAMADGHLGKCIECTRRDVSNNRAARIEYYRAYDRKRGWRPPAPEKLRARNLTRTLRRVPHVCSVCGAPGAEAHHEDYNKPLEVIWLCKRHHAERHRRFHQRLLA